MNLLIVKIIGASILLCVVGTLALSGFGKTVPDWSGHIVDVGIGALAGLVTGASAVKKDGDNGQDS